MKMLKETKKSYVPDYKEKNLLCRVLFPIKASVLFRNVDKSFVQYVTINGVSSPIRARVFITATLMRTWYRKCVRGWQSGTDERRSGTATLSLRKRVR